MRGPASHRRRGRLRARGWLDLPSRRRCRAHRPLRRGPAGELPPPRPPVPGRGRVCGGPKGVRPRSSRKLCVHLPRPRGHASQPPRVQAHRRDGRERVVVGQTRLPVFGGLGTGLDQEAPDLFRVGSSRGRRIAACGRDRDRGHRGKRRRGDGQDRRPRDAPPASPRRASSPSDRSRFVGGAGKGGGRRARRGIHHILGARKR